MNNAEENKGRKGLCYSCYSMFGSVQQHFICDDEDCSACSKPKPQVFLHRSEFMKANYIFQRGKRL